MTDDQPEKIFTLKLNSPDAKTATFTPAENKLRLNQASGVEKIISLGYAENRILQMLIENHGEPVAREEITDFAWNDRVVAPGSLSQAHIQPAQYSRRQQEARHHPDRTQKRISAQFRVPAWDCCR
ncbi:transcriptional regulator [Pseudomonas sp. QL9]|uniref:winged helix-turn-helix domain-containing protein n=1 Tax=Pseudomonas sp. QL9 TaxID=3242725 RepID=UPI00352A436C